MGDERATAQSRARRAAPFEGVAAQLTASLDGVPTPMYLVDCSGQVRWLNRSAIELLGDGAVGHAFSSVVAPDCLGKARQNFVSKVLGEAESTQFALRLRSRDGRDVPVQIASVPLRDDANDVVGVFGVAQVVADNAAPEQPAPPPARLTPRQHDVLELLAEGCSTAEIARRLSISDDTVRNHIRGILRELGVHTRLEAVVLALRSGWL